MHVSSGTHVDTCQFFGRVGVTDDRGLANLAAVFGPTHRAGMLNEIYQLVRHGCFRDARALRTALAAMSPLCDQPEARRKLAIETLAGLREFQQVATLTTARGYLYDTLTPQKMHDLALPAYLGPQVPVWLFPALVRIARNVAARHFGAVARKEFANHLLRYLLYWEYNPNISATALPILSDAYFRLKRTYLQDVWVLYLPPEAKGV